MHGSLQAYGRVHCLGSDSGFFILRQMKEPLYPIPLILNPQTLVVIFDDAGHLLANSVEHLEGCQLLSLCPGSINVACKARDIGKE